MKKYRYFAPALIVLVILAVSLVRGRREGPPSASDSALMMDTLVEVKVWGRGDVPATVAARSALGEIARVDSLLGDGRIDTQRNKAVLESPDFARIFDVAKKVYGLTGGLFDPTIGSVSRLWKFGEGGAIPDRDSLDAGLAHVGLARYLDGPSSATCVLDVGGVGKGYAVGLAAEKLAALGFTSAIVSAGGDMRLVGRRPDGKPWHIAIRHPRKEGAFIGFLDLEDTAVATSGDYERCFIQDGKRYHHILDPRTGMPSSASTSVTVVAADNALCDALSTGLFLLGPRDGLKLAEALEGVDAVFVYADGESVAVTSGLEGRFERTTSE
jgi:thiamine biosynthesis lipoprotein